MKFLLLAAALPQLLWEKGPETVEALRAARIPCIAVPAASNTWKSAGFCVTEVHSEELVKLPLPGVRWGTRDEGTASATTAPWLDANGWRFLREPGKKFVYDTPRDSALLAAAEAFAYGANAFLRIDPQDLKPLGGLLAFLKSAGEDPHLKPAANVVLVDNASPLLPEVLNLLVRRNLLVRVVAAPDPAADLNVTIGSPEFPKTLAANPPAFADEVRKKLTDRKRLLRIYGSEVVLGRLLLGPDRARVHLTNYTTQRVEAVRVRLRGSYAVSRLAVHGYADAAPADYVMQGGTTEFTVPVMGVCAVIDLKAVK